MGNAQLIGSIFCVLEIIIDLGQLAVTHEAGNLEHNIRDRLIVSNDCDAAVKFDRENKPGISNLLTIYCAATDKTMEEAEAEFAGQGYGVFKPAVAEAVVELLRPIREETTRLMADKAYLEGIYKTGAERAQYLAEKTLRKVHKKVGFIAR